MTGGELPLVSCIMPTAGRRGLVPPQALRCFLRQDYARRELIVIDDGGDPIDDLLPVDARVRYWRVRRKQTVGAKRNLACEQAAGSVIAHWDDDDWSAPWRLRYQVESLLTAGADICGLDRVLFHDPAGRRAWEYVYPAAQRRWVYGASLCYTRAFWSTHRFQDLHVGEDNRFVWADEKARIHPLADNRFLVARIHEGNVSPKRTAAPSYHPLPPADLERLCGEETLPPARPPPPSPPGRPRALVTAAAGIGDILRVTPLIRAAHRLGYEVDVLLATDYPEVVALLEGAPEIRRVFHLPARPGPAGAARLDGLEARPYDVATFTAWSVGLRPRVAARQMHELSRARWLEDGYPRCVEALAHALGWQGPLPEPFARASDRDFALAPGTLAIHPGCNPVAPWKRWHGFAELARRLPRAVIIGMPEDLRTEGTYFRQPFAWPAQARSFVGQLSLPDTAALLLQSAGLVANDSGLMHLAVALGVPAFGIFGITDPAREAMRSPHMFPVSKGLPCEPACRQREWGRRDCEHHLHCLKTLTAEEIVRQIAFRLPHVLAAPRAPRPAEEVSVAVGIAGGIGDALLASCVLRELFLALKGAAIDVFFHTPEAARFVFHAARFVRGVLPAAQFPSAQSRYDMVVHVGNLVRCEVRNEGRLRRVSPAVADALAEAGRRFAAHRGLAAAQPMLDGFWARVSVAAGRNRRSNMGYLTGLPIGRDAQLFLAPDAAEYGFFRQALGDAEGRYVTVHDGFDNTVRLAPGAATKCWPLAHWSELIRGLKQARPDLQIVQVGGCNSRPIPGVDLNLVQRTSLAQVPWILKHARLHIDGDSGLVHLARAVHTRSLVLFGPTDRDYFAYGQNLNLAAGACANCWWSTRTWLSHCPRGLAQPECMALIQPSSVLAAALGALADINQSHASVEAAALYGDPTWDEADGILADLFAVLDLPAVPISEHTRGAESGLYLHASKQWEYRFAWRSIAARRSPDLAGLRVADVGGGRGALAAYLATKGAAVEVFDQDYLWDHGGDPGVENRFLRWVETRGYRASFGSLFNLPAEDESFDVVTSISVIKHTPYKSYAVREALRVLKPGGLLCLTFDFSLEPGQHQDGSRREVLAPDSLDETLAALGIPAVGFTRAAVEASARRVRQDRVRGLPEGMTVGGLAIRKAPRAAANGSGDS